MNESNFYKEHSLEFALSDDIRGSKSRPMRIKINKKPPKLYYDKENKRYYREED